MGVWFRNISYTDWRAVYKYFAGVSVCLLSFRKHGLIRNHATWIDRSNWKSLDCLLHLFSENWFWNMWVLKHTWSSGMQPSDIIIFQHFTIEETEACKKHGGKVVMWCGAGGPVGLLIWNSAARVVWDHSAFRHLFISYCHGWDGRPAAASHTFKRPALLVNSLDQVSVGKSQSGGMPYRPAGPPFISIEWGQPSQGPLSGAGFVACFSTISLSIYKMYIVVMCPDLGYSF